MQFQFLTLKERNLLPCHSKFVSAAKYCIWQDDLLQLQTSTFWLGTITLGLWLMPMFKTRNTDPVKINKCSKMSQSEFCLSCWRCSFFLPQLYRKLAAEREEETKQWSECLLASLSGYRVKHVFISAGQEVICWLFAPQSEGNYLSSNVLLRSHS